MEAREALTALDCATETHSYIGDGAYVGVDSIGNLWLLTQRDDGWHRVALNDETLASLFRYARTRKFHIDS